MINLRKKITAIRQVLFAKSFLLVASDQRRLNFNKLDFDGTKWSITGLKCYFPTGTKFYNGDI